jgi:hypothetical protein
MDHYILNVVVMSVTLVFDGQVLLAAAPLLLQNLLPLLLLCASFAV